jgi:hypothetical protein
MTIFMVPPSGSRGAHTRPARPRLSSLAGTTRVLLAPPGAAG